MRTCLRLVAIFLSTLSLAFCEQPPSPGQVMHGVWYAVQTPGQTVQKQFSWGSGRTVVNGAIEIDMSGQDETVLLPGMGGPFRITTLKWVDKDTIQMSFYFARGGFSVTYKVHYEPANDTIWFEDLESRNFIESGVEHPWYKISGPSR